MTWTDNQRRRFCRIAFLIVCIVPTILVAWASTKVRGTADWELQIAANLGLDVQIGAVLNPKPGLTILQQVKLLDSGEPAGSIDEVQVHYLDRTRVELTNTFLNSAIASRLFHAVRVLRASAADWQVHGQNLQISPPTELSSQPIHFSKWHSGVAAEKDGQTWKYIRLDQGGTRTNETALDVQFIDQVQPGVANDRQQVIQAGLAMPGWLLSLIGSDFLAKFPNAQFKGTIRASAQGNCRMVNVTHSFISGLQIGPFRSGMMPVEGTFDLTLRNIDWRDGKIHRANLQILGRDGTLSRKFLSALAQHLHLVVPNLVDSLDEQSFSDAAMNVEVDSGVCQIAPASQRTNAILWNSNQQPLLQFDANGQIQVDLEQLVRIYLEPDAPGLLADDQLVEHLRHFHLPPDSRSARQSVEEKLR